jgi:hypothetical protein
MRNSLAWEATPAGGFTLYSLGAPPACLDTAFLLEHGR